MGFWAAHADTFETLGIYTVGIFVYALVVHMLYGLLSQRAMFAKDKLTNDARAGGFWRGMAYVLLFPLLSFAFFLVLAVSFILLGRPDQAATQPFVLALATTAAVRIMAYFTEEGAHELAKLMPLGLLGVFLVGYESVGLEETLDRLHIILDEWETIAIMFGLVVLLEFLMRFILVIVTTAKQGKKRPPTRGVPRPSTPAGPPRQGATFTRR